MVFLIFVFALLPTFNAPNPCAQQPTEKEQDRLMRVELKRERPIIISVNPEDELSLTFFPQIAGNPIIKMPEGWELLHLSNIKFDYQSYLVAQIQRSNDKKVLRMVLPMTLTISPIGDNTNRVWEERTNIAKYIDIAIKQREEKERREEIELVSYQKKEGIREAEVKKQRIEKEKQEKILMLKKRIFSRYYFDIIKKETSCYTTYSVTDAKGIVWEVWTCPIEEGSVRFFAVPAYNSESFIHNRRRSVIEIRPKIEDGRYNEADVLNQIKEVKDASLL